MSITYEEALATLESMFGNPWTRETLDAILRNQQGHMENTVDLILRHGSKNPHVLVDQLNQGINPEDSATALDAELARQLANNEKSRSRQGAVTGSSSSPPSTGRAGRGTPTTLPDDFLRISSRPVATAGPEDQLESDAALARMLQDELFSEELSRNPDFAHLARGRPRVSDGRNRISDSRPVPRNQANAFSQQSPNVMKKISELGDNARRRLQMLAAQFNANNNNNNQRNTSGASSAAATGAEVRGLLDGDDDDMELAARKDL
jgi:hypothetical protein